MNCGPYIDMVALDIATTTGYAYGRGKELKFNSYSIPKQYKDTGKKFFNFSLWVDKLLSETKPEVLVIEKPFARGHSTYYLMGLCAIAETIATQHQISVIKFAPTTIKKFLTGTGRASKVDMVRSIRELGYQVTDDNQADAIALHLYTQTQLNLDIEE